MASFVYNRALKRILAGDINLTSDTLKLMLVTSAYTPNKDHDFVDAGGGSDAADAEVSVTGYTPGWGSASRKTIASKTFTEDDTNDRAVLDAADVVWVTLAAGVTIVGAIVVIEHATDDTTTELVAYVDFADTPTNGLDFSIEWSALGILRLAMAA